MSKSWTNQTVSLSPISKGQTPVLNQVNLWPAGNNQSFYSFGGGWSPLISTDTTAPEIAVYQCLVDGKGDGTWTTNKTNDDVFNSLTRPAGMKSPFLNDTVFFFGGRESDRSSPEVVNTADKINVPGVALFNDSSQSWENDTLPFQWANTKYSWGVSVAVPDFGPRGLLMMLGVINDPVDQQQAMNNLTIYEPVGKTSMWQTATGTIPSGRFDLCSVGVSGDNGTYEV